MKYIRILVALTLFLSAVTQADTLYENAEEGNTNHWSIYDNEPSAASITNVYDPERGSKVIQFSGAALENGYSIGDEQWNNQTERTVRWSMQYAESFTVYISIQTTQGHRYIYYTPEDENRDIDGEYIHYGLGDTADNGRWQTFTRDLTTDLATVESDNEIVSVDGFLIRGSGKVDDIMLLSGKTPAAKLLFSSGFEDGVYIDDEIVADSEDYRFIRGKDTQTGYRWPIDVLGAGEDTALHYVGHDDFEALESRIETVVGHNGENTKALYVAERYDNGSYTQLPYEINNIQEGRKDLYIRYWMKLDSASLQQRNIWRALFEWKTKDYDSGDGFRLISYIYTDDDGKPYWHWQGDATSSNPIWEIDNKKVPVPMNEWFLTEYYWHWSEGDDGRALWKINGEVIGDHKGATTRNSKPIDFIMLSQIYGDGNPKHQWIDDVEIWDSLPEKYTMRRYK